MSKLRAVRLTRGIALAAPLALCLALRSAAALEQKLTAADGGAFDQFGQAVAIDGDTAVVGASDQDQDRGAAYVSSAPATAGAIRRS